MLNIVLYEPEIPANTGNIGRTCVATGTRLHLIEPLGFRLNEKSLKRAGMDYWKDLDVTTYIDYQDFLEKNPGAKIYMATTKAHKVYTEVDYESDCYIMFGKESAGIPEEIIQRAQQILKQLESGNMPSVKAKKQKQPEPMVLVQQDDSELVRRLKEIDIEKITPVQALVLLSELKARI